MVTVCESWLLCTKCLFWWVVFEKSSCDFFVSTFKVKFKGQGSTLYNAMDQWLPYDLWATLCKYLSLCWYYRKKIPYTNEKTLSNDLEHHVGKVKVISSKLTEKSTKAVRKHHNCSESNGIWTLPGIDDGRNNLGAHYLVAIAKRLPSKERFMLDKSGNSIIKSNRQHKISRIAIFFGVVYIISWPSITNHNCDT